MTSKQKQIGRPPHAEGERLEQHAVWFLPRQWAWIEAERIRRGLRSPGEVVRALIEEAQR